MKCKKNSTPLIIRRRDYVVGNARRAILMLLALVSPLFVDASAQPLLPPLNLNNATISHVLSAIEKESSYVFLVADDAKQELNKSITVNTDRASINNIMDKVLGSTGLSYAVAGNQVTVYKDTQKNVLQQQPQTMTVTGTVRDENGKPQAGVSVFLKSNNHVGGVTDANGKYSISNVPVSNAVLVFSSVGMNNQEVSIRNGVTVYDVRMTSSKTELESVVVSTGIYTRDQVTYTGSISTFKGEELRSISTRNVLEGLAALEPSLVMLDDINAGSNPNSMKNIEIRGQSAASLSSVQDEFSSDPNMPLFILNGVEVPYSRIHDLDPYRIESINVAKDAGATAIYGAKGANGVIIIETTKPKTGEYQIAYNGQFSIDAPDLSVYNMMNSREKLEFERLANKFVNTGTNRNSETGGTYAVQLKKLYSYLLEEIENGVDTYWLGEPVRTAFSNTHSISVTGGTEELSLYVSALYGKTQGVMKNNDRDRWGATAGITYRKGKVIISNDTDISGYNATESNFGSFSDWVNASPYYRKYNEDGEINKWLITKDGGYWAVPQVEGSTDMMSPISANVPNPLWNASLRSRNESEQLYLNNAFRIQYDLSDFMRVSGQFTLRTVRTQTTVFLDPDHTSFENTDRYKKGTYKNVHSKSNYYSGQLNYSYGQTFNDLHTVGANAYVQIGETFGTSITTNVVGFSKGSDGSPHLAHSYKPESSPAYAWSKNRTVGALFALNYSYNLRYLLDFTFRTDGSTTFGSNEVFSPFWSVGIGWNMHYENFAKNWNNIDLLKLTATIGTTGNQNIGQVASKTIYQYYVESNIFGQGSHISELGAPDLPWSRKQTINLKIDFRAWKGRFSFIGELYTSKTDPLIINVGQIPSTGLKTYPMHMGISKNKGVEFNLAYSPIYRLEDRIIWTIRVNGTVQDTKFSGFDAIMESMNKTMRESNTLQQYKDGYSPTSIWAVKSYGIDPATGREIYVKKDGTLTYEYSADDWVCLGDERPDIIGNIITNFRYKNLMFTLSMNYSMGGNIYNKAIYDKVENITSRSIDYNQDKRALYDRWSAVGQKAQFRAISIISTSRNNPITSRFIQQNDYLRGVSLGVDYDLNRKPWLMQNLGIQRMTIGFNANELFRFETCKYERGYDSPFARMYTLKVNIGF